MYLCGRKQTFSIMNVTSWKLKDEIIKSKRYERISNESNVDHNSFYGNMA